MPDDIDLEPHEYRAPRTVPSRHSRPLWLGLLAAVLLFANLPAMDPYLWGFLLFCIGAYVSSHYVRWVGVEKAFAPGGLAALAILIAVIALHRLAAPVIDGALRSLLGW